MRKLIQIAIAATMASLFAVMFWAQVATIATAVAGTKTETYSVSSHPNIQTLEPAY